MTTRVAAARPVSDRAQVYRDPADGVWLVQLPGRSTPTHAASSHANAIATLEAARKVDDYWRQQDPMLERGAEVEPRPTSFAGPPPRSSLWDYLGSPFRTRGRSQW